MTVQELLDHIAQLQKRFPDVDIMKAEVKTECGHNSPTKVNLFFDIEDIIELGID